MNAELQTEDAVVLSFCFAIRAEEMRYWHPSRIAQFFNGIAKAIDAASGERSRFDALLSEEKR